MKGQLRLLREPDNLDERVTMVETRPGSNVWMVPEIFLTDAQQREMVALARDGDRCRVAIHHGPGHQSVTECDVRGDHVEHVATWRGPCTAPGRSSARSCPHGSHTGYAEWTGNRDVFSDYFDNFDPDNIEYVRNDDTLRRRRRMAERGR